MKKLTLQLRRWTFTPGWVSSLTTLLLIPLLVYLGFWQMARYHEKLNNQQSLVSRMNSPLIHKIPPSMAQFDSLLRYRQLKITGHFLNARQIYLDNQTLNRQVGYRVITPFQPIGQSKILLIDRGWIPLGKSRNELPSIKPVLSEQTLIGTINLPAHGLQLNNLFSQTSHKIMNSISWPLRVQRIEFLNLESLLLQKLYPFILQLNPQDPMGFNIQPITFNPPPSRHLGYAIQWFAMAIAVLLYYFVINLHSSRQRGS
ncbi:MAG TPA: SURF1 family protein [Gammaproteobacteria bacterium]|nr:SURF1 family protein [Gammaproteobacteria bacterium]